ncbi:CPBP family glutamic-type intramembrane protease [Streptomyces sp. NPDC001857]|uniref:CPBP family intramembrane glutamic endopeptidase n=1 Tax=unclassified Streptomyces TaxID=2593676 RepID=UPI00332B5C81
MTIPPAGPTYPPYPAPPAPDPRHSETLAYHRLTRISARHRWWRPLVGTLFLLVGIAFTLFLVYGLADVWGAVRDYPVDRDGMTEFGPVAGTAVDLVAIAVAIPVVLLAVRWIGDRPAGTVSSVTGRLRRRLLGTYMLAALAVSVVTGAVMFLLPGDDEPVRWAGWGFFLSAMAVLLVLVPFQAAAEEYVFRGWLTQTAGAFLRRPWVAVVPQAVLFAAAHGWGTPWGFADLVVFGVVAGLLSVRTGGLEAGIALHTVNNLFAFGFSAAIVDGLKSDETAADSPWQVVLVDVSGMLLYAAVVLWLARRRPPVRTAQVPSLVPPHPYFPYAGHPAPYPGYPHAPYAGPHQNPYGGPYPVPHQTPYGGPPHPSHTGGPHAPYPAPHQNPYGGPPPGPSADDREGRADGAGLPPGTGPSASASDDAGRAPR